MHIQENIPLAPYTVFKVGGPARYFASVKTRDEAGEAFAWAREKNAPVFVLGLGSNILVSDKGFEGLAVKMELRGIKELRGNRVRAEAGVTMAELVA
ncbi:MAG: FAD-binding protein, partial [Patescibacteria group bacterium]